ncbi:MAG: ABC transporter permease [Prevotella sp.]|jgi:lipoprotein-releasing system permease protein
MNLPLFLAKRIFTAEGEDKRHVSKPAIRIATAGVAIGLAVMIVSVCVVMGFKHTVQGKVKGFGGDIQVAEFTTLQSSEQYPIVMNDSMVNFLSHLKGIAHAERFAMKEGILKTDDDFLGVEMKGVAEEFDSTFIHENMVSGSIPRFSSKHDGNKILISKQMADKLQLKAGDRVFAYFIDRSGVRTRRFAISGIYQTNLSMYDKIMVYADLYTIVKLNGWEPDQATGAELTVTSPKDESLAEEQVIEKVNRTVDKYGATYSSKTIREINPQIFAWLDLLDMNVWIILALMIAVSGVTMISGLLIIILERTSMIGILKALGARNRLIRHTFLWFATFIIGRGLLFGNLIGLGLVVLQRFTGLVKLDPTTYYVNTVPVEINWIWIVALNLATLIISVFVLVAPSYLISHIHPAKSMKYE